MNDNQFTVLKYAWVAIVAVFVLVFGAVWLASAPREAPRSDEQIATAPAEGYQAFDRSYARVPAEPVLPAAPIVSPAPASPVPGPSAPTVVVTPLQPRQADAVKPTTTLPAAPKPKPVTPRDMFPVGDITRDLPRVNHLYRQVAELHPSFEYDGKKWSSTGGYLLADQADLVATGTKLETGQSLYVLSDDNSDASLLFVQSDTSPGKFTIYRAT